jgi:hypothetical protein
LGSRNFCGEINFEKVRLIGRTGSDVARIGKKEAGVSMGETPARLVDVLTVWAT